MKKSVSVLVLLLVLSFSLVIFSDIAIVQATTYNIIVEVSSPIQNKTYFTNDIPLSFNYSTDIINSSKFGESRGVVFVYNLDGGLIFDMFGKAHFLDGKTTRIGQFYEPVPSHYTLSIDVTNGNHSVIVIVTFWFMREGELISIQRVSQAVNFTVSSEPPIPEFPSSENWNWVGMARITGDNYYSYETEPFNISSSVSVWRIVWEYEPRTDIPERQTGITINVYSGVSGDDKLIKISRMGIYNGNEDTRYFHEDGVFRLKISSNTQNFTVRIEQSMGYIPEPPSDNWVEVTRFIGTEGFTTDVFVCDHIEWRISWEFDPGHWLFSELHKFQVITYPEGSSLVTVDMISGTPGVSQNGTNYVHENPGRFYMKISAGIIENYTIIVEQNIDSIPEFPSWTPMLIMLVAVIAVAVIYRRKLQNQGRRNQ